MAKVLLDVILVEGTNKEEFIDSFNADTEADWWNKLGSMPTLIVMNVEEDYIETFRSHSSVIQATEIPEAFEANVPPSTEQMTKWFTSSTSSSHRNPSGDGEDNAPVQFIYDTNQIVSTNVSGDPISVGRDNDSFSTGKDETIYQRWTGKNVDIVTLEVGPISATYNGLHDLHPDFQKLSSEDDSHARVDPYWYQCTVHSNMKNTITINAADGTRNSYVLNVTGGSSYSISGSDRNGAVSGNNPALVFQEGDTVTFNVNAPGHPFVIRLADGGSNVTDGSVTNQGATSGAVLWTLRTASRFIPMDWPDLEESSNNQVTNSNAGLSNHGIGVLSASGGTICGFAKKANLRAMYLVTGDSPTECIQSVIDWHNSKPNNSETGVPDPTILIAEYQYLQDRRTAIPIDYIQTINKANGTTVTRPGSSWGTDYSEFLNENIIPWKVYSPNANTSIWCVVMPNQSHYSSLKTALSSAWSNGIVCINAAGNNGGTFNKENSQTDTSLDIGGTPTVPYDVINIEYNNSNSDTTSGTVNWYPFKSYGPHGVENNIDVAAGYNSEDYPGLDGYTNRGPGIDIVGLGANTYTSYQSSTYGTYKWGMFSGTSCATPTVVGKAACIMEEYFWYNDAWPTPDQTKALLLSKASNKCRGFLSGGSSLNWSSVPSATTTLSNEISSSNCSITSGNGNGGYKYTELTGTTHLRAYFDPQDWNSHPYSMRIKHHNKRPIEGLTYPRTNSAVGRHRMDLPNLT